MNRNNKYCKLAAPVGLANRMVLMGPNCKCDMIFEIIFTYLITTTTCFDYSAVT